MSVDSRRPPKSVDLEIDHRPDVWKVTLRSSAGAVTTSHVNLEEDDLRIQYGVKPRDVRVELTVLGKTMSGSVVTGEGDTLRRQSITAHRAPVTDAAPAPKQVAESNKTVVQAREFFGAWEISLRPVNVESAGAIRLGMVVTNCGAESRATTQIGKSTSPNWGAPISNSSISARTSPRE